jgi:ribosome-associated protein
MEMKQKGRLPINSNGQNGASDGRWVLQDFGDVVVHVFNEESRRFYELDEVWADARPVAWQRKKAAETPS